MKSLLSEYPEISKQWHFEKNGDLKPEMFKPFSNKKVWWLCEKTCEKGCKHEWESRIANRTKNESGCIYCSKNSRNLCVHTSIVSTHPEIAKQWNIQKNGILKPEFFSSTVNDKVWWICENSCSNGCKHEWESRIVDRCYKKSDCPYCSCHSRNLCVHTSIVSTHPEIAKQWNIQKNRILKPENFTFGSNVRVWWICEKSCSNGCKHEWETTINSRCFGETTGCPFCDKKKICEHESITFTHPEITKQWNHEKNGDLKPEMFSYGSDVKVWWICEKKCKYGCKHEWETTILSRCGNNSGKTGCPYCSNTDKICEHESITFTHPEIAKQWNFEKNKDLKPEMFSYGSDAKVWWICEKKHEWITNINSRNNGTGCPECKHKTETKFKEYLNNLFINVIHQYKQPWCKSESSGKFYPFDFYIEEINTIIEIDGGQHFKQVGNWKTPEEIKIRDVYKMKKALEQGISIIRVFQEDIWNNNDKWLDTKVKPFFNKNEIPIVIYIDNEKLYYDHKILMNNI
jgi:very-short-patch-repair endonuclease